LLLEHPVSASASAPATATVPTILMRRFPTCLSPSVAVRVFPERSNCQPIRRTEGVPRRYRQVNEERIDMPKRAIQFCEMGGFKAAYRSNLSPAVAAYPLHASSAG
jgi:hypothetical protein